MQTTIDSDSIPTFCSDNTSDPSILNGQATIPNGPATLRFVPNDLITESDDGMDEDIDDKGLSFITKLLRLNLALYKNLTQINTDQDNSPSTVMTSVPLEPALPPNRQAAAVPTGMIGRLLSLTDQFTTLLGQLGFLASIHGNPDGGSDATSSGSAADGLGQRDPSRSRSTASPHWKQHDPSTALLVLSCYLHLREVHSRSRRVVERAVSRDEGGGRVRRRGGGAAARCRD